MIDIIIRFISPLLSFKNLSYFDLITNLPFYFNGKHTKWHVSLSNFVTHFTHDETALVNSWGMNSTVFPFDFPHVCDIVWTLLQLSRKLASLSIVPLKLLCTHRQKSVFIHVGACVHILSYILTQYVFSIYCGGGYIDIPRQWNAL